MTTPRTLAKALALITMPALATLAGCQGGTEGGWLGSYDNFTYISTSWQPKTISLYDTRTGENLWSVDVPVGKQLNVGFRKGTGPNENKPDELVWEIKMAGRVFGSRDNRVPCPPATARRLEMTLRAAPEMPNAELPGSPFKSGVAPQNSAPGTAPAPANTESVVPPVVPVEPPAATPPPAPAPAPAPAPEPTPTPAPEPEKPIDLPQ